MLIEIMSFTLILRLLSFISAQPINRLYSRNLFENPVEVIKETTLERADSTFQLLMFVTAEKERKMFIISFLSSFVSCCPRSFKQGQAQRVQTIKA